MLGRLRRTLQQWVLRFAGAAWPSGAAWGRGLDVRAAVGDGRSSTLILACLRWAARTFPEAPLIVEARGRGRQWVVQPDHRLAALVQRPNPFYSGLHLWAATVGELLLTGNAYWLKRRDGTGRVVELWWVPSALVEPRWPADGTGFIDHYAYTVNGQVLLLPVPDVVHFREGFDPDNLRKGLSPLAALAREVFTDDEAARWTAALLRNMGVPGVILAPRGDAVLTAAEAERIKAEFLARVGGERRGTPLVFGAPTDVTTLGWSPEQMTLREVRRIPEERVTAVLGIPAIVLGLGAGLDRSTYANFAEAREAAYESFIIPLQRLLAAELNAQLVPDFGDPQRLRVAFDLSAVRVLQADENARAARISQQLASGRLTLNEARALEGLPPLAGGDVLLLPRGAQPLPAAALAAPPAVPADAEPA
jgi:HK97 family phage portal protein